jgi:hypothetical protein
MGGTNQGVFTNLTTTLALLARDGYKRDRAQLAYILADQAGNYADVKEILEKAEIYDARKKTDVFAAGDATYNGSLKQWWKSFQDNQLAFKLQNDGKIVILTGYFFGAYDKSAKYDAFLSVSRDPPKDGGVRSISCGIADSGTLEHAAFLKNGEPITVRGLYVHRERMLEPALTKCTILKPARLKK